MIHVNDSDFDQKVIKSKLPVLVDFFAEWCGPCKLAAPILEELSKDYAGKVEIAKLDVDESNKTAGGFGVMSIPTVIMFIGGKETERKVGFGGRAAYEEMIKKVI
jgi:thioredoxin 1